MTRRHMMARVWLTLIALLLYAGAGLALYVFLPSYYNFYKDLIPLAIAFPAAYLGSVFQQRSSYLQSLRDLWGQLIPAVHTAIAFARAPERTVDAFLKTRTDLSTAIDSLRGVFDNVPKPGTTKGLYPYENLKDILEIVEWMGWERKLEPEQCRLTQDAILSLWREMHASLLLEFDRDPPIMPVSKFLHPQEISVADKLFAGTLQDDDLSRLTPASHPDALEAFASAGSVKKEAATDDKANTEAN